MQMIPLGRSAPREILRRLKQNELVVGAMDRNILGSGRPFRFFGSTVRIPTGLIDVAQRTGAGILPVICLRRADDDYHVIAYPPMWVGEEPGAMDRTVEELLAMFEDWIRTYPDQWHVMVPLWEPVVQPESGAPDLVEDLEVAGLG
jgi:KDO2-lipid IV(A) lauroyltransferase